MSKKYTREQREAAFWARVDKNGPVPANRPDLGPCWLWTGSCHPKGYGTLGLDEGRVGYAHRFAYETEGSPVPPGDELDHLCRNPPCVRPSHLEPVSHLENLRRGEPSQRTHCPKGHPYDEENTYLMRRGGRQCRACGRERSARAAKRRTFVAQLEQSA